MNELFAIFRSPPEDSEPPDCQENTFREVITLQAILVTQTVALMAYVQREPDFQVRVELVFAMLAGIPMVGLYNILSRRRKTSHGEAYVYSRPIRQYARQAFFLTLLIVIGASYMYWQGLLPGQYGSAPGDEHSHAPLVETTPRLLTSLSAEGAGSGRSSLR